MQTNKIPNTYVPGRNTIFISVALSYAEAIDADFIGLGVNALDYSGYPDCRPDYIKKFQELANLANKRGRRPSVRFRLDTYGRFLLRNR